MPILRSSNPRGSEIHHSSFIIHHFSVYVSGAARAPRPGDSPRARKALADEPLAQLRVEQRTLELAADLVDVMRIECEDRVAADLRDREDVRCGDGTAGRHRLDDRKAEALVQRGKEERARTCVECGYLRALG